MKKSNDNPRTSVSEVPSTALLARVARLISIVEIHGLQGSGIWAIGTISTPDEKTVQVQLRMTTDTDDFIR